MFKSKLLYLGALALAGSTAALAGTICPAGTGANPFPYNPDNAATGCNVVITIAANGTASSAVTDPTPYEVSEDVLVGVKNNSSTAISALQISGSGIFGFDGDGICTYTFVGSSYCTTNQKNGIDPGDYQGPTSTFSNVAGNGNSGTVNFSPAIPAGGSSYFSLEGLPTVSLTTTVTGTSGGGVPISMPALAAIMLGLLGSAVYLMRRNRFA